MRRNRTHQPGAETPSQGSDTAVTKRRLGVSTAIGIAAAGLAAVVLTLTQPFWRPSAVAKPLKPVSNVSLSARACLLQAPAGNPAARPALQGLTEAAQARKDLLVQQFTVPANVSAASMLAELAALHCETIVTVGSEAEAQVAAHARSSAGTRYLVIGSGLPSAPDVTVLSPAAATPRSVESAVLRIVGS
jgi:hypothetical protein